MTREASKTNKLRGAEFNKQFLSGRIVDIGAGNDLVVPYAEKFDIADGDAQVITRYLPKNSYDAVHSSHCLEHMADPVMALEEWWELLKIGGYLVVVVPDEDLYEQGFWPSRFNRDHKCTFTLQSKKSWSPVSYNLVDLIGQLPGCSIVSAEIQNQGYNYSLQTPFPPPDMGEVSKANRYLMEVLRHKVRIRPLRYRLEERWFRRYRIPIDQTRRGALAQIQVVSQKIF